MNKELILAMDDLEKERDISKDLLIEAIESALVSAYKKNYGTAQNVRVSIDRERGDVDVFMRKDVVDVVTNPLVEVALEEARAIDPEYELGDVIEYKVTPKDFGRIAAQTAKQVVVQRIREAERGIIYEDYVNRQSEIVTGIIHRISNETVFVNLGRTEGILPVNEQVKGERYEVNSRIKVYIMDVKKTTKGPQVFLSRSHPGLVKRLFELEVPEIQDGIVEIKSIAREAGSRTKIAVYSDDENVDPVGACVGTRGIRVQAVVNELFDEKIDIINWSDDPAGMISNALAPAKVEKVIINEDEKSATVIVPDYQLSLAIGKEGQNVRLAAKLTGWKIDIKSSSQYSESADDYIEDEDLPVDYNDNIEEVELTDGEEMIPSEEDTAEKDAASEEVVEIDE
ncbi:MAG TPA: transcription termination factor NusA [Bacillota bacterium]|jgi:N utilization substance protein A|nr:transcription termination/antitermination protein NusA [Clostridiales bacterium UBA9856]HQC82022.1 transcription termination factor NusA [Bacillota bacterium]